MLYTTLNVGFLSVLQLRVLLPLAEKLWTVGDGGCRACRVGVGGGTHPIGEDASYCTGAPTTVFSEVPRSWSSIYPSTAKVDLKKLNVVPDAQSKGLGQQRMQRVAKHYLIPDDFGLIRNAVIQKVIWPKRGTVPGSYHAFHGMTGEV